MLAMQRPNGHIENWYGEGNFNRTVMLYALMKSQGVRPAHWKAGIRTGAVRDGERLYLSVEAPAPLRIQFDYARESKRVLNLLVSVDRQVAVRAAVTEVNHKADGEGHRVGRRGGDIGAHRHGSLQHALQTGSVADLIE